MTWEDILKNIEVNREEMCCEEARLSLIQYFEKHAELAGKHPDKNYRTGGLKESLIQTSSDLSEESCDELKESIKRFQQMYHLDESAFFDGDELRDIMHNWEKCEDEPKEIGQKDREFNVNEVFAENQTDWMNQYIRR